MIVAAIAEVFKGNYPVGSAMALSTARVSAITEIQNAVGDAIYWLRRPEAKGHSAIRLRTLTRTPNYTLSGEQSTLQPSIQVDVFTKGQPPKVCMDLADACRRVISNYRGDLQMPDQTSVFVRGATIESESTQPAERPVGDGAYWTFAAGFDVRVTYDRTVI